MIGQQYYIKQGNRFVPVNDPGAYDGLGKGSWLVNVRCGSTQCQSIRKRLKPKFIELESALRFLEDGLCNAMMKASKLRPMSTPITKKEQKAWKAFKKAMGKDMPTEFVFPAFYDIARGGVDYLREVMTESDFDIDKIKEKYEPKKVSINAVTGLEVL